LRLIEERKAEYVQAEHIPLELIRNERETAERIAELRARLEHLRDGPCPYRGLHAFEAEHAPFYFGRTAMTTHLVAQVRQASFVAVVGSSGSGKSSLVRAGLIHNVQQSGEPWAIGLLTPGREPLWGTAARLVSWLSPDASEVETLAETTKLATHLRDGTLSSHHIVTRVRERFPDKRLLLLVDQFEETFTQNIDKATQERFIGLLLEAADAGEHVHVVLAMRADFYDHVLRNPRLGAAFNHNQFNVLPLSRDELREAIEQPALQSGRMFESGLVERILDDIAEEPGNLPLLQFALTELWAHQSAAGTLTHAAYNEIGGVERALASYAEQTFQGFSAAEQQHVQRILVQLVQPGQGTTDTRRLATRDELGEALWPLITRLADTRLVVTRRDEIEAAEVAHEALIRGWQRLRGWMDADRTFRTWQERLRVSLRQWEQMDRDEGVLLRGAALVEAEEWLQEREADLSDHEREYIDASRARREQAARRERFKNRLIFTSAMAALMLAVGIGYMFLQLRNATVVATTAIAELNEQSRLDRARLLVFRGEDIFEEEPLLGLRLATEGLALVPPDAADAHDQIRQAVNEMAAHGRLARLSGSAEQMYPSPNQQVFVLDEEGERGKLYRADGTLIRTLPLSGTVRDVEFSPDSRAFVVAYDDAPGELYYTDSDCMVPLAGEVQSGFRGVVFSPDGRAVVVTYDDAPPELRFIDNERVITLSYRIQNVTFSPDGRALVVNYADEPAELRFTDSDRVVPLSGEAKDFNSVNFSPDSRAFVMNYTGAPGELRYTDSDRVVPLTGVVTGSTAGVRFSPDSRVFWAIYDNTPDEVRYTDSGDVLSLTSTLQTVVFSPDGDAFVVDYVDAPGELRYADSDHVVPLESNLSSIAFSPDGRALVVAYAPTLQSVYDRPSELRYINSDRVVPLPAGISSTRISGDVTFSPDSRAFVVDYYTNDYDHSDYDGPDELRFTDSDRVVPLTGNRITSVTFSPDSSAFIVDYVIETDELRFTDNDYIVPLAGDIDRSMFSPDSHSVAIIYDNGLAEIWDLRDGPYLLAEAFIGARYFSGIVDAPDAPRLIIVYSTGEVYTLDLAWLRAMHGDPAALEADALIAAACAGPFASEFWTDELQAEFVQYLDGREPRACAGSAPPDTAE
jgi:WD40 repeat protein/energy-coupling factor transporter ATP-binding protein EcfA2